MSPRRQGIELAFQYCPPILRYPEAWAHCECGLGNPPFEEVRLVRTLYDGQFYLNGRQGECWRSTPIRHRYSLMDHRVDSALFDQMEGHLEMAHGFTADHFPPLHMIRHAYVRAAVALLMD